jgi:hypothetical protein
MSARWIIEHMEVLPEFEGKENVVKTVHWRALLESETSQHVVSAYGSVLLPVNDLTPFTEFENLTEAQVVEWVKARISNVAAIESSLSQQLADLENPPVVTLLPPWPSAL